MEKITLLFEGKHIHCFESNGQMWFCGKDACDILGYAAKSHKTALNKIDETNKHPYSVFDPHAAHHEGLVIYISEFGVIELAIKCRFETAKPFREFVKQTIVDLRNQKLKDVKAEALLSYKSQLALTEKSHAELIAQYEKRIAEKDEEIKEKDEEIDEKDEELEQKDELLEEKDVEIDEMDQALEAKKIDACDERDREIRELKQRVDELTDENYRLKEILEAVPEKYRGEYEVDDYEFIPSKRAREEKRERDSRIDDRREIDSYFKSKIVELKTLYDAVDRWKVRYAGTTLRKNKSAYKANYETAHQKLVEYLEKLKREEFFTKCKRNLDAYPIKFWQAYNGKLTD
jgi:prophage antirepressor-like protein